LLFTVIYIFELSRLCPETSAKFYVHEFGLWRVVMYSKEGAGRRVYRGVEWTTELIGIEMK
jgi:hypothetical protein